MYQTPRRQWDSAPASSIVSLAGAIPLPAQNRAALPAPDKRHPACPLACPLLGMRALLLPRAAPHGQLLLARAASCERAPVRSRIASTSAISVSEAASSVA